MKKKGLKIHGSNLCNEIHLPTNDERTAVCCLSSLNLELYDEWKDTDVVKDLITFLDNVLQFFIDNAGDEIKRARYSATQERSLGLGAMGLHSLYQKHRIPFDSLQAKTLNEEIFKKIKEDAVEQTKILGKEKGEAPDMKGTGKRNAHLLAIAPNANSVEQTKILGKEKGEAPDMKGTGKRNAHLLAIAPNANSSMITGCSPSIEPHKANAYTHRTRAGSHLIKNRYLKEELQKINQDTPEVWTSIITNGGSVQHLDFINDSMKEVFRTAIEINQRVIIEQGGDRQKYLCQGQSLNIFFPAGASKNYLHDVHMKAWKDECKGLYYLRTETSHRAENVAEKVKLNKLKDYSEDVQSEEDCPACEG